MRFILLVALALSPHLAWAEEELDLSGLLEDEKKTEEIYKEDEEKVEKEEPKEPVELKDVSDLGQLVPFSDVAVLQKRYLPKTARWQLNGAASTIMNDPFFLSFAFNLRLAYYWTERYGAELVGFFINTTDREVTRTMSEKLNIQTSTLVTSTGYYGLDFKWVPAYGKYSFLGRNIIPFDLYFSLGGGLTTTSKGKSEPTLHIGTGQQFAVNKSFALRWDFSWNFYNATLEPGKTSTFDNLFLTMGMSYFFPEATYR